MFNLLLAMTLFLPATDPALNETSDEICPCHIQSEETQKIIDTMYDIAFQESADRTKAVLVGLAAPQIGLKKRIILVDTAATGIFTETIQPPPPQIKEYINPEILWKSDETVLWREGCFSTDSICAIVPRSKQILIRAYDRQGNIVTEELSGYPARVFQHELDHLDGIRFPDRVPEEAPLHLVEPKDVPQYRIHWAKWTQLCPREEWLKMKHAPLTQQQELTFLRSHFQLFYEMLSEGQFVLDADFETIGQMWRGFSGCPDPYHNAIGGCPPKEQWDEVIQEQRSFFQKGKVPFIWYLDEPVDPEFKEKLLQAGFRDGGVFRGVLGVLDQPIPDPEIPEGVSLHLVETDSDLDEWADLVCTTFGMKGIAKEFYKKVMGDARNPSSFQMFHWIARKERKAVSAVSTLIQGKTVSFWNAASLPEVRKQGLNTALWRLGLKDAVARGCRFGTSYLMSEGLAYGICQKLGYETKWHFRVFLSPEKDLPNKEPAP